MRQVVCINDDFGKCTCGKCGIEKLILPKRDELYTPIAEKQIEGEKWIQLSEINEANNLPMYFPAKHFAELPAELTDEIDEALKAPKPAEFEPCTL